MPIVKMRNHDRAANGEIGNVFHCTGRIEPMVNGIAMVQGFKCAARVGPVRGAVDSIVTRFGNLVENCAAGPSKLSRKVGSLDADFLDCVWIGDGEGGSGNRYVVVLNAINHEIVAAWPLAIDGIGKRAVLVNGAAGSERY